MAETLQPIAGRLVSGPPKSYERRTVPMPKFVIDEGEAHLAMRAEQLGRALEPDLLEQYVAEAEAGFDLSKLRPRGRPRLGSAPAKAFPVRLDPALRAALDERAEEDGRPASEIVREALRQYLDAS